MQLVNTLAAPEEEGEVADRAIRTRHNLLRDLKNLIFNWKMYDFCAYS